ncbi:hypothetical protein BDA96_06G118300 [Sorghum bicolor]|uniref:Uncharacterized protein n=1 Tax=Sorghum bicolor TaxID=4558 RepID=A0A921UC54_SORBI|nr:hypothetical protein BDA96_06G118300 [Sorghum bicolor]
MFDVAHHKILCGGTAAPAPAYIRQVRFLSASPQPTGRRQPTTPPPPPPPPPVPTSQLLRSALLPLSLVLDTPSATLNKAGAQAVKRPSAPPPTNV